MTVLTEEHIWDILDGEASPEMRIQHEAQLLTDEAYRTTFVQCTQLHKQLLNLPLESPSMRFNENLMERLAPERRTAPKNDRFALIFLAIFSLFSCIVGALIFSKTNQAPSDAKSSTLENLIGLLSNPVFIQVFMLLNIVLFLAVMDKKVLKPYFENRTK
jgi:hypothetical protein